MKAKKARPGSAVSAKRMRAMKMAAQARDRALVVSGTVLPEAMFFIRPEMLRGTKVKWPKGSLLDPPSSQEEDLASQAELIPSARPSSAR